jgi:hypothetical protein
MIYYFQKKGKGFKFEMCRRVRFRIVNDDVDATDEILGGIGIYEKDADNDEILVNVICGCCGCIFEPEDVEILEKYHSWKDLTDIIIGA